MNLNQNHTAKIADILEFWFTETSPKQWYMKDADFDKLIADRFSDDIEMALAGDFDSWTDSADGRLALILLLDQMTRNVFRDTPKAFSGDDMACALSIKAATDGIIAAQTDSAYRQFYLMPMMHSEDIAVQKASLPLFKQYTAENTYDYAIRHHDIIEKFGRFPHRNIILGRASTDEELAFLKQPNSSF